jgi:hypothetical protein
MITTLRISERLNSTTESIAYQRHGVLPRVKVLALPKLAVCGGPRAPLCAGPLLARQPETRLVPSDLRSLADV